MFPQLFLAPLLLLALSQSPEPPEWAQQPQRPPTPERRQQPDQTCAECQRQLNACAAARERAEGNYRELKQSCEQARNTAAACDEKLADANRRALAAQGRLADAQGELSASRREAAGLNTRVNQLNGELSAQRSNCEERMSSLRSNFDAQLAPLRAERDRLSADAASLRQQNGELSQQLALVAGEGERGAQFMLAAAQAAQSPGPGGQPPTPLVNIKGADGKVHVIKDLIIGILDITYDEKRVRPGQKLILTATFKPRRPLRPDALPRDFEETRVEWFMELAYSPRGIGAVYDRAQSGDKEQRRVIDLGRGGDEMWVWTVSLPDTFEQNESYLGVFAEYQVEGGGRAKENVLSHMVSLSVPPGPGFFAVLKENLNYILGIIVALLSIYATYLTIRQMRTKETPAGGGTQTSAAATPGGGGGAQST